VHAVHRVLQGQARESARLIDHPQHYRFGGPLIGPDGKSVGSLLLFEVQDRAQLDRVMAVDPFFREGLYQSIEIHPTRQIIPETAPGLLALELDKELQKSRQA
jgi:uncharacterized protein YciI